MHTYGRAAIAELLSDFVAYRGLRPADGRLPGLSELAAGLGLPADAPPRKGDMAYAAVVAGMLRAARALDAPGVALRRLLLVGDTRGSDGGAFATLCAATGWEGRAFIGAEELAAPPHTAREGNVTFANRWGLICEFAAGLGAGFPVDEATVVVLDIDKTLVGARGRNDGLIDAARLRALRGAVADALGGAFDPERFAAVFQTLNQPRFHPLTADNQDYVGYLCAMIAAGAFGLERAAALADAGGLPFPALLGAVEAANVGGWPSPAVAAFHAGIAAAARAGDPTPFKAFRRREFAETAALMGRLPDGTPPETLLREELVLTAEVWQVAQVWQARGALLFGLSDKPDEAALPPPGAAGAPLHRVRTHVVGM
jgi:hypothetical protein